MRTDNLDLILRATNQYADHITGFYPKEWIDNPLNIALINDNQDISLFEFEAPGVVSGHYFFWSRGKIAVKAAKEFLNEIFTYDIKVVRGITPITNLGARWVNRQLGLKSYGIVQTTVGPCEIIILTKQEWETKI